jgi:HTH-type transcriptional regulator/antitoxin HipB
MLIRTPTDLGAAIREQRRRRRMDQQRFARKIGVSRQWVVEVEKGKPRAEVGLILRALAALGVALSIAPADSAGPATTGPGGIDIDRIVDEARERKR